MFPPAKNLLQTTWNQQIRFDQFTPANGLSVASTQIVQHDYFMSSLVQCLGSVRAYVTSATANQ